MLEENCYLDPIVDRSNILEKNIYNFIFLLFMGVGFIVPCQCCFSLQFYVIKKLCTVFLFSQNVFLRFSNFYLKLMVLINNFVIQGIISDIQGVISVIQGVTSVIHFLVAFLAKETTMVESKTPLCEGVKV